MYELTYDVGYNNNKKCVIYCNNYEIACKIFLLQFIDYYSNDLIKHYNINPKTFTNNNVLLKLINLYINIIKYSEKYSYTYCMKYFLKESDIINELCKANKLGPIFIPTIVKKTIKIKNKKLMIKKLDIISKKVIFEQ